MEEGSGARTIGPQGVFSALARDRYLIDGDHVVLHVHYRSARGWEMPPRVRDKTSSIDCIVWRRPAWLGKPLPWPLERACCPSFLAKWPIYGCLGDLNSSYPSASPPRRRQCSGP